MLHVLAAEYMLAKRMSTYFSVCLNFFICKVEIIACILKVMVQMKDNVGKAPGTVLAPG